MKSYYISAIIDIPNNKSIHDVLMSMSIAGELKGAEVDIDQVDLMNEDPDPDEEEGIHCDGLAF